MLKVTGSTRAAVIAVSAGVVIAIVGVAASPAGAGAAAKKGLSSVIVESHATTITTSTHHKLQVRVQASDFVSLGKPDDSPAAVSVELSTPNGHESHTWTFQLSPGSFTDHVKSGTGDVTTGAAQISPYGRVRLTFRPTGAATMLRCGKTTVVTRHVKVNAAMSFDTGTSWGDVGSYPTSTHLGVGTLRSQRGGAPCPEPPAFGACQANVNWNADQAPLTFNGEWTKRNGKKHALVTGSRLAFLTTPAEANRIDTVTTSAPAPTLADSHGVATLDVSTFGGRAVGSATLVATAAAHPDKVTCDTKHHHDSQTTWTTASYTNGTTPLTLHEEIEGSMKLPDSANDGFIQRNSRLN